MQFVRDLVTFTEKILNGKLFFFCSVEISDIENLQQWFLLEIDLIPAGIYLLKVNSKNIRTRCEIYVIRH